MEKKKYIPRYYEKLGYSTEAILRCESCGKLQRTQGIRKSVGCSKCGNRKFNEVRALSSWEWFKIRVGLLRFPYWKEFLKEFSLGGDCV